MTEDRFEELLNDADFATDWAERYSILQQRVQLAEAQNDVRMKANAYDWLATYALLSAQTDIGVAAFSQYLSLRDQLPPKPRFDRFFFVGYRRAIIACCHSLHFTLEIIEQLIADLCKRISIEGGTPSQSHDACQHVYVALRDHVHAASIYARSHTHNRERLNFCRLCNDALDAEYFHIQREWERVIEIGRRNQEFRSCGAEKTLALSALACARSRRHDEALQFFELAYPLVKDDAAANLKEVAFLLTSEILSSRSERAKPVFQGHLATALNSVVHANQYAFLASGVLWCQSLLNQGLTSIAIKLPEEVPVSKDGEMVRLSPLREWLYAKANDLALKFDARNQNNYHQDELEELITLLN